MNRLREKYGATARWMWSVTKGYRGSILWCVVLGILKVVLGWCFILLAKRAVDIASGDATGSLLYTLLGLPVIILLELLINAVVNWLSEMRNVRMDNELKQHFFRHLLDSQWRGIERYHTGDVINRIERDVSTVVSFATITVPDIFILIVELVGSFFLLWTLDSTLAWIVLSVSPVFLLVARLYAKKLHRITRSVRDTEGDIQSNIQENLQHRAVIKTLEQTGTTMQRLGEIISRLIGQVRKRTLLSIYTHSFISGSFAVGYVMTFSWGVLQISRGLIGYGTMVAFLQLSARVQRPIVQLGRLLPVFVRSFTSAERLLELLDLPLEEKQDVPSLSGALGIRFRDVDFRYPVTGSRDIFSRFEFDFTPGSSTAILGETGAGKTTLIRLLLALVTPERGAVELYTQHEHLPLGPGTRKFFSYVPQGNTLLSGTIRSNLLLGNPQASDAEMREALHGAAADFVMQLPDGLETRCGERGGGLSEGQAQRVAIARALLRDAPILLLDEATSALDPETEQLVIEHILHHSHHRTLIMVTHRPAAAERCGRTLRLS